MQSLVIVVKKWIDGLFEVHESLLVLGEPEAHVLEQLGRVEGEHVRGAVVEFRIGLYQCHVGEEVFSAGVAFALYPLSDGLQVHWRLHLQG